MKVTSIRRYLNFGFVVVLRVIYLVLAWETIRLYWMYSSELLLVFGELIFLAIFAGLAVFKLYKWLSGYVVRRNYRRLPPRPEGNDYDGTEWVAHYELRDQSREATKRQNKMLLSACGVCFWLILFASSHVFADMSNWVIDGRPVNGLEYIANPDAHRITIVEKGFVLEHFFAHVQATTKDNMKVGIGYKVYLDLIQERWVEVEERDDFPAIKKAAREIFQREVQVVVGAYTLGELQEPFFFELQLSRRLKDKFDETGYRFTKLMFANVNKLQEQ